MRHRRGRKTGTGHGRWQSSIPKACQICCEPITVAFIDGKTRDNSQYRGSWAIMCPLCETLVGVGLGLGKGQMYDLTGKKVEG